MTAGVEEPEPVGAAEEPEGVRLGVAVSVTP